MGRELLLVMRIGREFLLVLRMERKFLLVLRMERKFLLVLRMGREFSIGLLAQVCERHAVFSLLSVMRILFHRGHLH
jgi:hypothetical protein